MKTTLTYFLSMVAAMAFCSCGEDKKDYGLLGNYYPMEVGNWWEYEETYEDASKSPETNRHQIIRKETVVFDYEMGSREVYVVENSPDLTLNEQRTYYVEDDGAGTATRLRQVVYDTEGTFVKQQDYVDGFQRFDRSKQTAGEKWSESFVRYTSRESAETEMTFYEYNYEIISLHESVSIESLGKTFDCVVIKRTLSANISEEKIYYFAPGIGKIKEVTSGQKTELLSGSSLL